MDTIVNLEAIVSESTKNRFEARIIGIVTASNRTDPAIWDALSRCDIAELRADGFPAERITEEARSFRAESSRKLGRTLEILLTIRLKRDGGAWPDEDASLREPIWLSLCLDGGEQVGAPICDWIDVEIEEFASLSYKCRTQLQSGRAKLLLSHHDFRRCRPREGLHALMGEMQTHRPAGMKFAVACENRRDLMELLAFARDLSETASIGCALSMGEVGRASRVLGPLLGCPLTYGYLTGGAVAPGQLSAEALRKFFQGIPARESQAWDDLQKLGDSDLVDWAEARIAGDLLAD